LTTPPPIVRGGGRRILEPGAAAAGIAGAERPAKFRLAKQDFSCSIYVLTDSGAVHCWNAGFIHSGSKIYRPVR
jgi:hypothetical protein